MTKKVAGKRTVDTDKRVPVFLKTPQWRGLAAVLYSAASITTDPVHRRMMVSLYDEIAKQANVEVNPVVIREEPDAEPEQ